MIVNVLFINCMIGTWIFSVYFYTSIIYYIFIIKAQCYRSSVMEGVLKPKLTIR